jgi:hypothetical protein
LLNSLQSVLFNILLSISSIYRRGFKIEDIKETVYQGTLNPLPKALFVVMRKSF